MRAVRNVLFGDNAELSGVFRAEYIFDDAKGTTWAEGFALMAREPEVRWRVSCGVCSTPRKRKRAMDRIAAALLERSLDWHWCGVKVLPHTIHPTAEVNPTVYVAQGAYIGARAQVGAFACVLPGAFVHHDTKIGQYSIICGGAQVLGYATVKQGGRICTNAVVFPYGEVGEWATLGALTHATSVADRMICMAQTGRRIYADPQT